MENQQYRERRRQHAARQCFLAYGETAKGAIDSDGCRAIISEFEGRILVAITGTRTLRDWMLFNFRTNKVGGLRKGAFTHSGFTQHAKNLLSSVSSQEMELLVESGKSVIICGHSLGGASATVCAVYLADLGVKVEALITYGCPRVGNRKFRDLVHSSVDEVERHVATLDVVPMFPTINYWHTFGLQYHDSRGNMVYDSTLAFRWIDRITGLAFAALSLVRAVGRFLLIAVSSHSMSGYDKDGDSKNGKNTRTRMRDDWPDGES